MIEDNGIISNIYDKIVLSEKTGKTIFCDYFFAPNIWKNVLDLQEQTGLDVSLYGAFDDAERKMIAFNKDEYISFPVKLIRISNLSHFSKPLHKDYLGSLMALGIKREKMGDLICYDNVCVVPVCEDIHEYIVSNFKSAGNSPCSVSVIDSEEFIIPDTIFDESIMICASTRLDAVVGSLCNISRSSSSEIISRGKVLIDYCECLIKDKKVDENSIITVRGYGKFKVKEQVGFTKGGNLKIKIKKYK